MTRLIVLNPIAGKIVEKTASQMVKSELWSKIDSYQNGSRPNQSTLSNITAVLYHLKIAK